MIGNTFGTDHRFYDKLHFFSFQSRQLDKFLGAVDKYLVLTQSVHSKNDINALRFQDNEFGDKVYLPDSPSGIAAFQAYLLPEN
jgi:hypothetical protein